VPDRVAPTPAPVTTGADQPGRTELLVRTAGRSWVERWITDGRLRPVEGSALEPNADGSDGSAANPDIRCPTGWPAATARGSGCPSACPCELCAKDRLPAAAGSRPDSITEPGSVTERRIGCRKLAIPNGRPGVCQEGGAAVVPDRTAGSAVLGIVGSGPACRLNAGLT
jgi:hypothetical protein